MSRKCRNGNHVLINCFNFVLTCAVLIVANSFSLDHFTDRINKISNNLNNSLGAALKFEEINYTSIYENVTFYSTTTYNPRGMAVLYNITSKFMNAIASKDIYPEGLIKVENGQLHLGSFEEQWQTVLAHYGALLAVAIVLLLFAILMPICGFFFCCCRCCGKCGGRSKPFDKKGDLCKKICFASLLICVGTLLLFGVVCTFVTNQALQDNTYELSPSFRKGIKDASSYLMYTGRQIHGLLNENYQQFQSRLFSTLDECSDIVSEQLEELSNATSLTEMITIVEGFDNIKMELEFLHKSTMDLQTNASQLADGLRIVQRDLLSVLRSCNGFTECNQLSNTYINSLKIEIDFDTLPDITEELGQLKEVLNKGITEAIHHGEKELEKIRDEINRTVSSQLPEVKLTMEDVGRDLMKYAGNISSVISQANDTLRNYLEPPIRDMDKYVTEYTPYRYYLGIGIGCILLLVSLCITLGLICGICGKRPDAYGDDCCNKGAGSRFLMLGVSIMFLFSIILAIVAIVYLFTGILAQRLACDSLRNPNQSQVINLVDKVVNFKKTIGVDINVESILSSIHNNRSIYYTFEMKNNFDLEKVDRYLEQFEINELFAKIKDQIRAGNYSIQLIDSNTKKYLTHLTTSNPIDNIDYDKFIDELQHNLTSVDLSLLATKLDDLIVNVNSNYPQRKDITPSLSLSSLHLRTYQKNLVDPMTDTSQKMMRSIEILKRGFSSTVIKNLLDDLEKAEKYLKENGTKQMEQIADEFASGLKKQMHSYVNRTVLHFKEHLGATEPLSLVFNATLVATCDKIILPWNGFWFSILWCLILFVPAIILSVKLAGLYQKYEAYPGPLVEARNDKQYKKKKKHRRRAYAAESTNEAREVPSGSARYADMAPKHWEEFPAGGPPHYQRAPTEYERPPPYYYPGTEQQQ